jgi:hypothetical protein
MLIVSRPKLMCVRVLKLWRVSIMCVAVLGILPARSAALHVPSASPLAIAVSSHLNHDYRQCFDHEDMQWGVCPHTSPTAFTPSVSPLVLYASQLFVESVTDGLHFNRPPPRI